MAERALTNVRRARRMARRASVGAPCNAASARVMLASALAEIFKCRNMDTLDALVCGEMSVELPPQPGIDTTTRRPHAGGRTVAKKKKAAKKKTAKKKSAKKKKK